MVCPNCYGVISGNPALCPRCGWNLQAPAAPSMQVVVPGMQVIPPGVQLPPPPPPQFEPPVPLTAEQKKSMLWGILASVGAPVVFGLMVFSFSGGRIFFSFAVIIGLIMIFSFYQALKQIKDYTSGVAQVVIACLEQKTMSRGQRGPTRYYGKFTGLETTLQLTNEQYGLYAEDLLYRLVYSPSSKQVWSMEPVWNPAPTTPQLSGNQW